jgi:guanylate kinase
MLLDIDVRGALQVRASMPEAVLVFVAPPDRDTLLRRLRGRGTEDEAVVARRMAQAAEQLEGIVHYDYVVTNDDLDGAAAALAAIVRAERHRRQRRAGEVANVLAMARAHGDTSLGG